MDKHDIKQEAELRRKEELSEMFRVWLANPMTRQVFQAVSNHRNRFLKNVESLSMDDTVSDAKIRLFALGAKTTSSVLTIMSSFEEFYINLNKQEK